LTFSCYHRFAFLRSERTCLWLVEAINSARVRRKFDLWAFVFMPEHVHLLVRPGGPDVSIASILDGIKRPVSRRAVAFLRQRSPSWLEKIAVEKSGRIRYQFWQKGGGYDRNITEPKTLFSVIAYIHDNPVRRSLVEHPGDFPWSSASWYEDGRPSPLPVDPIPPDWCDAM